MDRTNPILLYDGSCGFCQQSVQFILQHERGEEIFFAPLQGELAKDLYRQHPKLQHIDSIVLVKGKEVLVESDAVMALAAYLHAPYRLGYLGRFIPRTLRDKLYRLMARNRHRFIRGNESCLLPTPQQRRRFLK
jgi:predicted DCC family thiol-disulfide oxidoreductase YuxK